MGSWIGGDRDGNPNVNAGTMQHALQRHSTTILELYLDEVHVLGAELPGSTLTVSVNPELEALAQQSPETSARRSDEPYRHALIGIYARLGAKPTFCAMKSTLHPTTLPSANSRKNCKSLKIR